MLPAGRGDPDVVFREWRSCGSEPMPELCIKTCRVAVGEQNGCTTDETLDLGEHTLRLLGPEGSETQFAYHWNRKTNVA